MKISINNFKSIGSLVNYEMQPLTILSGTNSSGKSSFIQLLLLLKQTLEDDSAQRPLDLGGDLFKVRNYLDILKDKKKDNKLKVEFTFNKSELSKYKDFPELRIYEALDYNLHIEIKFDFDEKLIIVSSFSVKIETEIKPDYIKFENNGTLFNVETNVAVFSEKLYGKNYSITKINYSSFIPTNYEIAFSDGIIANEVPKLDGIKAILKDFFTNLNYVGPLRNEPKDIYPANGKSNSVGKQGENVADIFCELAERPTIFFKIEESESNVNFVKIEDTFINAVKYWLCERFNLCANIYSRKEADSYIIYVESLSGITSTIKHVGFGISQVLPIIVEGLRIANNETFILEQPEIHLHPKVQSGLTDFLISLIEQGKKVIIETHSDHLITRLRRRIAEDQTNQLDGKIQLTFVEVGKYDILFRNITIDDFGVIELPYPEGFIEKTDAELKAILRAQMNKRLNQQR
ncbi:putative ATPase [Chryseobacterium defluvii]|uniref:Putative ATPase n=1 Tax=Chryseobacterium defluvii TaxID=160396 RepID=A0A840KB23_9FLAO|nr:AAA family ATPase [Chryseobacterium defluvii]MBB4804800.1 putative ATPase [Chryseobacterium defluvii]